MRIHLLGTAAGGGVPQWNCRCAVCCEARARTDRVQPRTQSTVAISADDRHWFLLNASPDLRTQLESFPPLHPPAGQIRGSTIEGVVLTNADLDHTLGLPLLREGERFTIHATAQVRRTLTEGISLAPTLDCFCGVNWVEPASELAPLRCRDGAFSGLRYQAISVAGKSPRYHRPDGIPMPGAVVGYRIVDDRTKGRLVFLPEVAHLDEALRRELSDCEVLLFDGTFWSETDMSECGVGTTAAAAMGHLPISGANGSLRLLAQLRIKEKVYFHLNNTNPVLFENSPQRAEVTAGGCKVAHDGMEFVL
jgi:pyrroloquinoline quinone biosynthesis protein B